MGFGLTSWNRELPDPRNIQSLMKISTSNSHTKRNLRLLKSHQTHLVLFLIICEDDKCTELLRATNEAGYHKIAAMAKKASNRNDKALHWRRPSRPRFLEKELSLTRIKPGAYKTLLSL